MSAVTAVVVLFAAATAMITLLTVAVVRFYRRHIAHVLHIYETGTMPAESTWGRISLRLAVETLLANKIELVPAKLSQLVRALEPTLSDVADMSCKCALTYNQCTAICDAFRPVLSDILVDAAIKQFGLPDLHNPAKHLPRMHATMKLCMAARFLSVGYSTSDLGADLDAGVCHYLKAKQDAASL